MYLGGFEITAGKGQTQLSAKEAIVIMRDEQRTR